jgi:hypothetical protein
MKRQNWFAIVVLSWQRIVYSKWSTDMMLDLDKQEE